LSQAVVLEVLVMMLVIARELVVVELEECAQELLMVF
jgi:hypothetical protein